MTDNKLKSLSNCLSLFKLLYGSGSQDFCTRIEKTSVLECDHNIPMILDQLICISHTQLFKRLTMEETGRC